MAARVNGSADQSAAAVRPATPTLRYVPDPLLLLFPDMWSVAAESFERLWSVQMADRQTAASV